MNKLSLLATALAFSATSLVACVIPMSTRDAQEAQMRQYQRMCADTNYAYETGNNDGMKRRQLDTSWVQMYCAPQYQEQVRTAYQSGYQLGIQNAPVIVEGRGFGGGGGRSYGYSSAAACTFDSDCGGEGYSCRPDANGTKVCMGYGSTGDACWFGSECLSGTCSHKVCR